MLKKILFILILLLVLTGCKGDNDTKSSDGNEQNSSDDKKKIPVVEFRNVVVDKKNLSFDFVIKDDDQLLITLDIVIHNMNKDSTVIKLPNDIYYYRSVKYANWTYDRLDPFTNYCIMAIGSTQNKSNFIFGQACFKTEMFSYYFEIGYDKEKTESAVTYTFKSYEYATLDYINEYRLSVYIEDELKQEFKFTKIDETVTISNLEPGIIYKIILTAYFDNNPEPVKLTAISEFTPFPITIQSITSNKPIVQIDEDFELIIRVNNDSLSDIKSVSINGERYTNLTIINDTIRITLKHVSEEGVYKIENIEAQNRRDTYNYSYNDQNTFQMKTLGEFDVYSAHLNEHSSFVKPTDVIISVKINIMNHTGYLVKSVNIDDKIYEAHEFSQTVNEIIIPIERADKTGLYNTHIPSLTLNDGENDIVILIAKNIILYYLNDTDIKKISTPEELMNIQGSLSNRGFYELTNDIDMTGYNFIPIEEFYGCISGNGYTISNLTIDTSNQEVSTTGIFNVLNGIIENLTFSNVTVKSNWYAAIVAQTNYGVIRDVTVEGNLYLLGPHSYIGGISVYNHSIIQNVNSNITLHIPETSIYSISGITQEDIRYNNLVYSIDNATATINLSSDVNIKGSISGIARRMTSGSISRSTANFNISLNNQKDDIYINGFCGKGYIGSKVKYSTINGTISITPMDKGIFSQFNESELDQLGNGNVSNLILE